MMREGNVATPAQGGKMLDRIATVAGRLAAPPNYFVFAIPDLLTDEFEFRFFGQKILVDEIYREKLLNRTKKRYSPFAVYRFIVQSRPALVHQHWATWSTPAVLASKRLGVPLVLSIHGYDAFLPSTSGPGGRIIDAVKRRERKSAIAAAAVVVVNSDYMMRQVISLGVKPDVVKMVRHGVDTSRFAPNGADRSGVLFVGRLSPEKGCALLVEALAKAQSDFGVLTVVGDGDQRKAIVALAEDLGVPVRFLGSQDRTQVAQLMTRARLVVVPSIPRGNQREASGLVPLEAQASGTPTIVTRVGGLPENIPDGLQYLIAEPNASDLARVIDGALNGDLGKMSQLCREHIVRHHSNGRVENDFRALFRDLIDFPTKSD